MKNLIKYSSFIIIFIIFHNCHSDIEQSLFFNMENVNGFWEEEISKKNFISDYLNENTSIETSFIGHLPSIIKHSLVIEKGWIVEYISFTKDNPTPIAKFPIIIENNKIIVLHPKGSKKIISEFYVNYKGQLSHDTNQSFDYINSDFHIDKEDYLELKKSSAMSYPCPGIGACITLCHATHRALDVPQFLDSICCFFVA